MEELGAALGVSYLSARYGLVTDALELRYRLPRLWTLVHVRHVAGLESQKGRLPHPPTLAVRPSEFVDRQVALFGRGKNRIPAKPPRPDA